MHTADNGNILSLSKISIFRRPMFGTTYSQRDSSKIPRPDFDSKMSMHTSWVSWSCRRNLVSGGRTSFLCGKHTSLSWLVSSERCKLFSFLKFTIVNCTRDSYLFLCPCVKLSTSSHTPSSIRVRNWKIAKNSFLEHSTKRQQNVAKMLPNCYPDDRRQKLT